MTPFETATKLLVEAIDKDKLNHVTTMGQATSLELLSVVQNGIIKDITVNALMLKPFEPDKFHVELPPIKGKTGDMVDGKFKAKLKRVFDFGFNAGGKVFYKADFAKLRWSKLKNHDSLIKHLKSGVFSIPEKSGLVDKFREFVGISRSFNVVTSVVHTTSPTEIILIYQSERGGSIMFSESACEMVTVEAGLGWMNFDDKTVTLLGDTPIAYGYVEVLFGKNGSVEVKDKYAFDGKMIIEPPSSTSAADASSTDNREEWEQEKVAMQEKMHKLEVEVKEANEGKAIVVNSIQLKNVLLEEKNVLLEEKIVLLEENAIRESAIRQEMEEMEEMNDQLQEEMAREVKINEDLEKELTANKEIMDRQCDEILQLKHELDEQDKIIDENSRRIHKLEAEINRREEGIHYLDLVRLDIEAMKKYISNIVDCQSQLNPQIGGEEVLAVPEPDSRSVVPKLDKDDEDEEVPATESECAVAKVGQGASSYCQSAKY